MLLNGLKASTIHINFVYKIITDFKIFSSNFTVQNLTVSNIFMGEIRAWVLFLIFEHNYTVWINVFTFKERVITCRRRLWYFDTFFKGERFIRIRGVGLKFVRSNIYIICIMIIKTVFKKVKR